MALNNLKDSSSDSKSIIFLSDGYYDLDEINRTTHETTRDLITKIQKDGIKIYTIGFNAPYEGKNNLKYMAEETNGKFFEINSLEDAKMIFNTINVYKNLIFTNPEDGILDSDNDGLLDFFETQEFKLANGKTINLKDYCNNPETNPDCDNDGILDGEEITLQLGLFRQNNNINSQRDFYLVINSYPDNSDSDNDYYMDNVDTQKLHFDAMQIIDEKLNDDNSIDGTNPSADNNDYTDGILNSVPIGEGECSKNEYTFTRNTDKKCEFTITPKKNSDYTISISNPNCLLNISNKEKFSFIDISNNSISGINKTDNSITYNLVLKKDVTYNIYIEDNSSTNSQYAVSVSQDNWVYAPNDGTWNILEYNNIFSALSALYVRNYISPKLLIEATCKQLPNNNEYDIYTCYTEDDIIKVLESLNFEDPREKEDTLSTLNKVLVYSGVIVLVVGNFIPGVKEIKILNLLSNSIGGVSTVGGSFIQIYNDLKALEDERLANIITEGNLAIINSKFTGNIANIWDTWDNYPYINKFQNNNIGSIDILNLEKVKEILQ